MKNLKVVAILTVFLSVSFNASATAAIVPIIGAFVASKNNQKEVPQPKVVKPEEKKK